MEVSEKEKKRLQHEKELTSFRNRMGKNTAWFDALHISKRYDILFKWKREKYKRKIFDSPKPANLKHFIISIRKNRRFIPNISYLRQASIDIILNKKN